MRRWTTSLESPSRSRVASDRRGVLLVSPSTLVTSIDPLVRRAPRFPRRAPAWSLAITLAVACFAAARATAPLVTDAAADRSFAAEAAQAKTNASVGQGLDARAYTAGLTDAAAARAVSDVLDGMPVFGVPRISVTPLLPYAHKDKPVPVIRTSDGRQATAVVMAIDDASSSLTPASGTGDGGTTPGGIWVPESVAATLGVSAGGHVTLALQYPTGAAEHGHETGVDATVAGVYTTRDGVPTSGRFDWQALRGSLPTDPQITNRPANLLLADIPTAMSLIAAMGDTTFVKWDVAWTGPVSLEQGRAAAKSLRDVAALLADRQSAVWRQVDVGDGDPVVLSSGVRSFVQRSEEAAGALQPVVSSIALTAQVMSLLVLVICMWLLTRGRRREHALSLSMGSHPLRLGLLAALEQLIPITVGVAAAYATVRWWPRLVAGQGAIDSHTIHRALRTIEWAYPMAIAAVIISGFAAVWPLDSSSASRAKRVAGALHAETVVVVGAIATGAQLVTQRGSALDSGSSLLFPMLAVLAGSVVIVRVATLAVRWVASRRARRRRWTVQLHRPRSLAAWLARRRMSLSLTELSALVVVIAAGVGLFSYCASISTNGQRGVDDKAAAVGGAPATVAIASTQSVNKGDKGFPTDLPAGWTVVWEVSNAHPTSGVASDLLAIDPTTFLAAADWRDSFSREPVASLMDKLSQSRGIVVNIVVAGDRANTFPDTGTMEVDNGFDVQYRVVARIAAAPWQRERWSMTLVDARALAPLLGGGDGTFPGPVDTVELDHLFRTYVWSNGEQTDLNAAIGSAALDAESPNVSTARHLPAFIAFTLSLPYLRLVGIALLIVALASIVVLGARRRTELAIELAMTDKMGMPRRTIAVAVAGSAVMLGAFGSLIGVVLARLLVAFMTHRLDPGPAFVPHFTGGLAWSAVSIGAGAVVLISLVTAWLEISGARRARVSEVLRDSD